MFYEIKWQDKAGEQQWLEEYATKNLVTFQDSNPRIMLSCSKMNFYTSPSDLPELSIALEMLGKFGFTTSSSLIFAYTTEIYPTVIRSTATGTCATISRVGSCIAPFVFHLGEWTGLKLLFDLFWHARDDSGLFHPNLPFSPSTGVFFKYLPYILLGSLAVVSAIATLFLPETFGKPLPETFEQMGKRERWDGTTVKQQCHYRQRNDFKKEQSVHVKVQCSGIQQWGCRS